MKLSLIICLLTCCASAHAALHKWVDANGEVQYSDGVPPPEVKASTVRPPPVAHDAVPQKSTVEREADWRKAQKSKEDAAKKAAQTAEETQDRKSNCEAASRNLAAMQCGQRITTYNAKGETVLMDDSTRQQRMEEARKQVTTYCTE